MRTVSAALLALALTSFCVSQLVQIGPSDPNYCGKVERIKANLHVPSLAQLAGHVEDQTGAPFESSRIELKRFDSESKQVPVANTTTDNNGNFDLGQVQKGNYRLLASPTQAFKQPDETWCKSGGQCFLQITLRGNPSDLPASQCPIR